jgi:hypothetical protein
MLDGVSLTSMRMIWKSSSSRYNKVIKQDEGGEISQLFRPN